MSLFSVKNVKNDKKKLQINIFIKFVKKVKENELRS